MKNEWKIISKVGCPWCEKAKELFIKNNIDYEEQIVTNENKREVIDSLEIGNHRTFPIIFYKNQFIGGYDKLQKYVKNMSSVKNKNLKTKKKKRFNGTPYYNLVSMLYLQKKYPNICVVIPDYKKNIHSINHSDISIRYYEESNKLLFPNDFWKKFSKCKYKRFILFPFGYSCKESGHANYMIYDNKKKTLERFEPYGKMVDIPYNQKDCFINDIDNMLIKEFSKKGLLNKYYKPSSFIPDNGFQTIQENEDIMDDIDPEGYCSAWSLFYCDLRMTNPDISNEDIINYAIKYIDDNKESFTDFIRTYADYLVSMSDKLYSNYITSLKSKNKY